MLYLPKNIYYTKRDSLEKKVEVLTRKEFLDAYNELVQKFDFNMNLISESLRKLGYQHNREILRKVKNKLIENGIWKKDGKKDCLCGFRTNSTQIIGAHRKDCSVHNKLERDIESMLEPQAINQWFENGILPIDVINKIIDEKKLPETYRNFVYNKVYHIYKKLSEEGKIIWSADSDIVKKVNHERSKQTIKRKYGVDNISKLDYIKAKKRATNLERYGKEYVSQVDEFKKKAARTIFERYGVDNVSKSEKIKKKKAETFMKNYGQDNIFRRYDLMTEYWKEKLNAKNPINNLQIRKKAIRGIQENSINISEFEKKCVSEIRKLFDKLLYKYELFTTRDKGNIFADDINNKIYIPDIVVRVHNYTFVFEAQDNYHKYPKVVSIDKVSKDIHNIWNTDLQRYMYFNGLKDTYIFAIWEQSELDIQLNRIKNIIRNICDNNCVVLYDDYYKELISMYKEKLDAVKTDKDQFKTIESKSGRKIATF